MRSRFLNEWRAALAVGVGLVALGRSARADGGTSAPTESHDHWAFAAGAETAFPVNVAARVDAETPFRLRLSTSIGIVPSPYVKAMNAVLEDLGAYDAATGNLITSTLQSSLVWRTHVGIRPFSALGLYGDLGYGLVTLGGTTSTSDILSAATGKTLSGADAQGAAKSFDVKSTLHMLDVEIGWTFPVAEHWQLRTALGGAFTLAAPTSVSPQFTPRSAAAVATFTSATAQYLSHEMTSYVFTPVISLGGAYVF